MDGPTGRIVLLNGTSSSGKSSVAAALLDALPDVWFHLPVDALHAIRSRKQLSPAQWEAVFARTRAGYHAALAALAHTGNDVVGDHVLSEPWRLADLRATWLGLDVLLVAVRAPLAELEHRERSRGDRTAGTAAVQFDTCAGSPAECAAVIAERIRNWPAPTAYERLTRLEPDRRHGGPRGASRSVGATRGPGRRGRSGEGQQG